MPSGFVITLYKETPRQGIKTISASVEEDDELLYKETPRQGIKT